MNLTMRKLLSAGVFTLAITAGASAQMPQATAKPAKSTFYTETNLVASTKGLKAKIIDKNLLNPWGLVQGPTPFWISDNKAGVSTLYEGKGTIFKVADGKKHVPFVVTVAPPANSTAIAAPTGVIFNGISTD